jgi:hypothetical protein
MIFFTEPEYYLNNFNKSLTGEQIANAYRELRNLLNSNNLYKNSIIIGPSTSTYATALSSKEKKILDEYEILELLRLGVHLKDKSSNLQPYEK